MLSLSSLTHSIHRSYTNTPSYLEHYTQIFLLSGALLVTQHRKGLFTVFSNNCKISEKQMSYIKYSRSLSNYCPFQLLLHASPALEQNKNLNDGETLLPHSCHFQHFCMNPSPIIHVIFNLFVLTHHLTSGTSFEGILD